MKKNIFTVILTASVFLISCKKEQVLQEPGDVSTELNSGSLPAIGELTPFGILSLNGGTLAFNGSRDLTANVGYSSAVTSNINERADGFTGAAYVHSNVSSFNYAHNNYQPSAGIIKNNVSADEILNRANIAALYASSMYANCRPDIILGNLTSNQRITGINNNTLVKITSLNYDSKTLTLIGRPGQDDGFIFNVSGNFNFSQSEIKLVNVRPERVLFNFPNPSTIAINKAFTIFNGTILAPLGNVDYQNPATFNGAIIALKITVHSDFNLTAKPFFGTGIASGK